MILSGEKLKVLILRSGTKQRCPLSSFILNTVLEVLAKAIGKEKNK